MGRETRILLGLLGLLAGLFVGVLSLKLLVPRPPLGAGPDVHGDVAFTVRQELVPPPVRGPRAADFAAAPPLVAAVPPAGPFASPAPAHFPDALADPSDSGPDGPPPSRFGFAAPADEVAPLDAAPAMADPFVQPAAFAAEEPSRAEPTPGGSRFARPAADADVREPAFAAAAAALDEPPSALPASRPVAGEGDGVGSDAAFDREAPPTSAVPFPGDRAAAPVAVDASGVPPVAAPRQADPFARPPGFAAPALDGRPPLPAGPLAGGHVVAAGDSWWSLAERAYGDGRLYRALYAWNRARNPRVALVPGTGLEIPPVERLAASWPALVPAGR
jgi:nucleoid-associated protein YgaU